MQIARHPLIVEDDPKLPDGSGLDVLARVSAPRVSALKAQEWEPIRQPLADGAFTISEAARRLGLHRRTLARKLAGHPVK